MYNQLHFSKPMYQNSVIVDYFKMAIIMHTLFHWWFWYVGTQNVLIFTVFRTDLIELSSRVTKHLKWKKTPAITVEISIKTLESRFVSSKMYNGLIILFFCKNHYQHFAYFKLRQQICVLFEIFWILLLRIEGKRSDRAPRLFKLYWHHVAHSMDCLPSAGTIHMHGTMLLLNE